MSLVIAYPCDCGACDLCGSKCKSKSVVELWRKGRSGTDNLDIHICPSCIEGLRKMSTMPDNSAIMIRGKVQIREQKGNQ